MTFNHNFFEMGWLKLNSTTNHQRSMNWFLLSQSLLVDSWISKASTTRNRHLGQWLRCHASSQSFRATHFWGGDGDEQWKSQVERWMVGWFSHRGLLFFFNGANYCLSKQFKEKPGKKFDMIFMLDVCTRIVAGCYVFLFTCFLRSKLKNRQWCLPYIVGFLDDEWEPFKILQAYINIYILYHIIAEMHIFPCNLHKFSNEI